MQIYFTEKDVTSDVEAIKIAGNKLLEKDCVLEGFIQECVDREGPYPTGLVLPNGKAVAMPHGDSSYVKEDSISIVRSNVPIIFKRMEDATQNAECNLVFNLALSSGGKHIQVLRNLMGLFQGDMFINNCVNYDGDKLVDYVGKLLEEKSK